MRIVAVTLALCSVLLLAGCGGTSASGSSASTDPAAIINEKCTRCHGIDRIKAAQHDAAGWQSTVNRMVTNGAQLTPEQQKAVIDYLANGGAAKL